MTQFYAFLSKPIANAGKLVFRILWLLLLTGGIRSADGQNLIRNGGADTIPVLLNPTYNFWSRPAGNYVFGWDHTIGGDWYLPSSNSYYPGGSQSGAYFFCVGSDPNNSNTGATDEIQQTIDLTAYTGQACSFSFNGYASNAGFEDVGAFSVNFYDASSTSLYNWDTTIDATSGYALVTKIWNMPLSNTVAFAKVSMSGTNGGFLPIQVFFDGLSLVNGPVLPINLLDFTAVQKPDNTVGLLWHTAQEQNSHYIEIQRSANGKDFVPIGQVPAAGNSNLVKEYSFIDESPIAGNGFYRLRLVDLDASFKYSKIVEVRSSGSGKTLEVFNNPFYDQIGVKVSTGAPDQLILSLTDMTGRVYLRQAYNTQTGNNFINIYPSVGIPRGVYLLNVKGTNTNQTIKVLKQ